MAKPTEKAEWKSVAVSDMPPAVKSRWEAYLKAKADLTALLQLGAPSGFRIIISTKFDQLSLAQVRETAPAAGKFSFDAWKKAQEASGRRT
jgi:hypothetical protein